jgi:spore coat protein B
MNKEMIHSLVDRVIKVDRGGPESRVGRLLAAEDDYFALLHEEEGIIYYNTQHIKSVTYNSKSQLDLDEECSEDFSYIKAKDFKGILQKLTLRWVKINRGGPETLEGVMDVVTDDFVTIVANEEIIRVSLFHIRNISYGIKKKADEQDDKAEGKDKKQGK